MPIARIYTTSWCADHRYARQLRRERGISFEEINVDEDPDAEELLLRVNDGLRKVPTIELDGRYFACSPFDPEQLAAEFAIPRRSGDFATLRGTLRATVSRDGQPTLQ
jgi:mycoredoxin